MAQDSFTNSDATALATHNAAWAQGGGYTNAAQINTNQVRNTSGYQNVCYYYSTSSSENCQIAKKALSDASRNSSRHMALVRANASRLGYGVVLASGTGDSASTTFSVYKNGASIGAGNIDTSTPITSDYTLRIKATTVGSDVEIRVWVNGVQQAFTTATAPVTRIDSNNALQDPSSNTPLTDGSPGFFNSSSAHQNDTYWDDFDDLDAPALTKKLKALIHPDSIDETSVQGAVYSAPTGGDLTGGTKYGEFTGATIAEGTGDDAGYGVLKVDAADWGGTGVAVDTEIVLMAKNTTYQTGVIDGVVIQE